MKKVVIILAETDDIHALSVQHEISNTSSSECLILDTKQFPTSWALSVRPEGDSTAYMITADGNVVIGDSVTGVWLRRTKTHLIPDSVTEARVRNFCINESRVALQGWLYSLGRKVINPLAAELAANRKINQLHHAAQVGLSIPKTLVTNSPLQARRFNEELGYNTIFKILGAIDWCFLETRPMRSEYERLLESLRFAPIIFQEKIDGVQDIRVTVVDRQLFPVGITAHHPGAAIDWRLDLGAEIRPHELPTEIGGRLLDLMHALGLRFGAIDLRLTHDGEYKFFEVNPAGQFLFAEIHGNQAICRALARSLLSNVVD